MQGLRRSNAGVLQKRQEGGRAFGKAKRTRFLDALAETCNVRGAARTAGVCPTTVYALRRSDGTFAQLWADAIDQGQERMREELIARALGQVVDEENPDGVRMAVPGAAFDPDLALRILRVQARVAPGGRRAATAQGPTIEAVHAALAKRLDEAEARIARRNAAAGPLPIACAPEDR